MQEKRGIHTCWTATAYFLLQCYSRPLYEWGGASRCKSKDEGRVK